MADGRAIILVIRWIEVSRCDGRDCIPVRCSCMIHTRASRTSTAAVYVLYSTQYHRTVAKLKLYCRLIADYCTVPGTVKGTDNAF
jgi:hypothetical protein